MRKYLLILIAALIYSNLLYSQTSQPNPDLWVTNGNVYAVVVEGDFTYIGGSFTYVGPNTRSGAKLTTSSATPSTSFPKVKGTINAAVSDKAGGWYIGGDFTKVGTFTRNRIAHIKSDGSVDATWNPNANDIVRTIAISGSDIYIGGRFTSIGGQTRNHIAKLNNTNGNADSAWNPNAGGRVRTIAISGSDIYVGGDFLSIGGQTRNYIAKLNNTNGNADANWDPNPNRGNGGNVVNTIAIIRSDIYVGGFFQSIGGQTRNHIAKLNNTNGNADANWDPNPKGDVIVNSAVVNTITINGSDIYVGGFFQSIGGQTRNHIAKLNNTNGNADANWDPNANSFVRTIAISGSNIYVGGMFTSIGGQTRNRIAKLNNTNGNADITWNPNPNGGTAVNTIAISGSDIYVGGDFSLIGGLTRNRIAKLNNTIGNADTTWNPNPNNSVHTIAISGSDIYVGGIFSSIGGLTRLSIAKLNNTNGDADSAWNPNAGGDVRTIAISGSDIYVGGEFSLIGGQTRNYIAKLKNTKGNADATWNPNADFIVFTIAINGSDIYAGGQFTSIGGLARIGIAKLNNTNGNADIFWSPNPNEGTTVTTIAISGNDIYVGGYFTTIGGQTMQGIAKLNNSNGNADATWNPNPNGGTGVNTIAISGSDIYAGGIFSSIGGQTIQGIAKLNNSNGNTDATWNPNPNGGTAVNTIAISGNDIYAGGDFTSMGSSIQPFLALFTNRILTAIDNISSGIPKNYVLSQNYPNPFNPSTNVNISIPQSSFVTVKVYDVLGKEISTLVNEELMAGSYKFNFNARGLASGIYFYRITAGNFIQTKKMILLR